MRRRRRSRSLQLRVLALVGAGVFLAGAALSLLSRSALRSLEREVAHDHERLATSIARDISRAVSNDMRLLARAAAAPADGVRGALLQVREFGRVTSAAFIVDASGAVIACEPVFECGDLDVNVMRFATTAIQTQRPAISNLLPRPDGRARVVGLMPFRHVEGQVAAAAGISIDPRDRRIEELLVASDIAPTLLVYLRDGVGQAIAGQRSDPQPSSGTASSAAVAGTPWVLDIADSGPDPRAPIAEFRRDALWLAPTLAAVAMMLGWGVARSVRQPLLGLTAAAERIARGELEQPIDEARAAAGGQEVARLATALERMRSELLESIGEIERTNQELEQRVADRTRELAAANLRLEEREKLRQKLLRQVISAQEDERKRVARELHDETSQTLAALGMDVDLALAACTGSRDADIRSRLNEVRRLLGTMHQEVHRMIVNLRPSVLDDLGLAAGIRWLAEHHLTSAGVAVRCELSELDERLPAEIETATFRIVQEALVNVARHASADTVLIQGSVSGGRIEIDIEDDGVGFDSTALVRTPDSLRGVGLLGMQERVEILGGSLTVESSPGSGTRVVFSIPILASAGQSAGALA